MFDPLTMAAFAVAKGGLSMWSAGAQRGAVERDRRSQNQARTIAGKKQVRLAWENLNWENEQAIESLNILKKNTKKYLDRQNDIAAQNWWLRELDRRDAYEADVAAYNQSIEDYHTALEFNNISNNIAIEEENNYMNDFMTSMKYEALEAEYALDDTMTELNFEAQKARLDIDVAMNRGASEREMLKLQNKAERAESAHQAQQEEIKGMQSKGKIKASMAAGRSSRKAAQVVDASMGMAQSMRVDALLNRNSYFKNQIQASYDNSYYQKLGYKSTLDTIESSYNRAQRDYKLGTDQAKDTLDSAVKANEIRMTKIAASKYSADLQAKSQVLNVPQPGRVEPLPYNAIRPEYQEIDRLTTEDKNKFFDAHMPSLEDENKIVGDAGGRPNVGMQIGSLVLDGLNAYVGAGGDFNAATPCAVLTMAFKSSASPGSYSQVIPTNLAFSKTRRLQQANQKKDQERREHTRLLAERNRNNLNSLQAAYGVEGQSRTLALNDEANRRQVATRFEQQNIQNAYNSAIRNAEEKASREINSAKEIEGFVNKALGTGLDIYQKIEEDRIKQGTRDLNVLTLKYGINAKELAGIKNLTEETWRDQGRQEGLAFSLRERGLTWNDIRTIQGAHPAAHAAVAMNAINGDISSAANNYKISTDIVPGTNMTPGQLLEEGTQEAVNKYNVGFRDYVARIIEAGEKLGVTNFGPFVEAVARQEAINNSFTSQILEASAAEDRRNKAKDSLLAAANTDGGIPAFLANLANQAQASAGTGVKVIEYNLEQLVPLVLSGQVSGDGLLESIKNTKLSSGATIGSSGQFAEELVNLEKAVRTARTGEHTDFRQEAQAAERFWAGKFQEFAKLSPTDQRAAFPEIAAKIREENGWNAENLIAKFQKEANRWPTPTTEAQRNIDTLRGKYGVETIPTNKLLTPYPFSEHENLRKEQRIARTAHENLPGGLRDEINKLGGRRITFAAPNVGVKGDPGENWFKREVRRQYWADVEDGVFNKGLTAEQAHKEAMAAFKKEFNEGDPFGKGGRYEIWDASDPEAKGRTGFKNADQEKVPVSDRVYSPSDVIEATKDPNNVQWEKFISPKELLNILGGNPNATAWNKLIHARNNLGQRSTPMSEFVGGIYKEMTGNDPPAQVRTGVESEALKEFRESLTTRGLPENSLEYAKRGSGVNTGIIVTSARDASGEPGSDFVISNGERGARFNFPYPSRVIRIERNSNWETNLETNPNGRRGPGNFVELEVQLPNGTVSDVRIAHLDDVANIQVGQELPAGSFVGTQGRTGSTSGAHMSLDWYKTGTTTPDWSSAEWFLNNYLRGNQPQPQPQQPTQTATPVQSTTETKATLADGEWRDVPGYDDIRLTNWEGQTWMALKKPNGEWIQVPATLENREKLREDDRNRWKAVTWGMNNAIL